MPLQIDVGTRLSAGSCSCWRGLSWDWGCVGEGGGMGQGWSCCFHPRASLTAFAHGFEVHAASCPCSVSLALAHLAAKESSWYPQADGGLAASTVHPIPDSAGPSPAHSWSPAPVLVLLFFPNQSSPGCHLSQVLCLVTMHTVNGSSSSKVSLPECCYCCRN